MPAHRTGDAPELRAKGPGLQALRARLRHGPGAGPSRDDAARLPLVVHPERRSLNPDTKARKALHARRRTGRDKSARAEGGRMGCAQPAGAENAPRNAAVSRLTILSIAPMARRALKQSGSAIISPGKLGTSCQHSPKPSFNQPQACAEPPASRALQSGSSRPCRRSSRRTTLRD